MVVTPGAKPIMYFAILALVEPGDEVIYPDPGFPIYESMTRFTGGTPVPYALREENGFRFDPDELRALVTPRTKLIIFNSPHNPTGGVLTREDITAIAAIARERQHHGHGRRDLRPRHLRGRARLDRHAARHDGADDHPRRLLQGVGHDRLAARLRDPAAGAGRPVQQADHQQRLVHERFEQIAAVEALNGPQDKVREMVEEFRARRQIIVDGLNAIPGIRCRMPHGAFYVFPNVAGTGMNGSQMADKLLHEGGVCVLSGTAFGQVGKDHVRISYANSRENLKLALERIAEVVSKTPAGASA